MNGMVSKMTSTEREADVRRPISLHYGIDDNPPWYICLLLAFQVCSRHLHSLSSTGGQVYITYW